MSNITFSTTEQQCIFGITSLAIIEEAPKIEPKKSDVEERPLHILTLSAKTEPALNALVENYQTFLETTNATLADICYTANTGRNHERYRIAIIANDLDELKSKLSNAEYLKGEAKEEEPFEFELTDDWNQLLNELAEAYIKGGEIDWKKFDAAYARQKIILPTYPFQRIQYPIKKAIPVEEKKVSEQKFMYQWNWQQHELGEISLPEPLGHWLVFSDDQISDAIIEQINNKGGTCRCVSLSDHPKTKDQFVTLLQEEPCNGILHFSSTKVPGELTLESIQKAQVISTESLLNLTQALVQLEETLRVPLFVISSDELVYSPIQGLFKTISGELPEIDIKLINFDTNGDSQLLFNALFNQDGETFLKLTDKQCYVPRVEKLTAVAEGELNVSADATYLITGGLGGLGLTLAKWLTEKGAGRLVLTGRSEPNESILKNLENDNTEIVYEALDVSDEKAVEELLIRLTQADKPLKGIFHLAGVLDDGTLLELDWSRFETVFASKVYGSYYLHRYSKELDYFVLYSSVASTLGNPGQANYASACAFMDALSELRKQNGLAAHSISWGPWSEVGMAKDLESRQARFGMLAIKPKQAISALEKALLLPEAHITIANINWKKYIEHRINPAPWLKSFGEHVITQHNLGTPHEVKDYVTKIVREVFGTPESQDIDEQMGFFDMGMDSLMAIEIRHRFQVALGKDIILESVAVLNYSTIEAMSQHISELLKLVAPKEEKSSEDVQKENIDKAVDEMNIDDVINKLKGKPDGE